MSTALAPPPAADPIRSPLDHLGQAIRRYVLLEALIAAGFFVIAWYWLGLALDFGAFKLFGLDWVQILPWHVRAGILTATLLGLAAVVGVRLLRLRREFRPDALALVLERRFPAELGDRLITAVELADLPRAEAQGYSRPMIEETIREASARVAALPLDDVLDWPRLKLQARWLLAASLGVFIAVAIAYSAVYGSPNDFFGQFGDVSGLFAERNLLLRNTIWPRKAHLELIDFPAGGELKVGRDAPAPRLRIVAYRWVIADPAAPEGWRGMRWADLTPALLGEPVPTWPQDDGATPTLDDIERQLTQSATRAKLRDQLPPDAYQATQRVFETLAERAASPAYRRQLRRLEIPERVELNYWGAKSSSRIEMNRGGDGEFSATLSELRESVDFTARGGDYVTPRHRISVVPPPQLVALARDEAHPAYLYHRPPLGQPPEGGPAALRWLKHLFPDARTSLNGPLSRIEVPRGSDVVLRASVDKPLEKAELVPRGPGASKSLPLSADGRGFTAELPAIDGPLDFDLAFTDSDGVRVARHVVVEVVRDPAPKVAVLLDGLRKTPAGYLVTPVAMLPVAGTAIDRSESFGLGGLDRLEYALTVVRLESAGVTASQAGWVAAAVLEPTPLMPFAPLAAAGAMPPLAAALASGTNAGRDYSFPVEGFAQLLRDRAARDVLRPQLVEALGRPVPQPSPLVTQYELKPQFEFLDLRERLPELKVRDEQAFQPRYRVRLTVRATDNNVETGPGIAVNDEPPFTVLVVSEAELLVEIAKDEEAQHLKLEDVVGRLRDAKLRLEKVAEQVNALPADQLGTMALRALEIQDSVAKGRDVAAEVLTNYSRILRELELNRVLPKLVEKVKAEICLPLESVGRVEFPRAEEGVEQFRKELDAARKPASDRTREALTRIDQLIDRLNAIMTAMGDVTTINKLIGQLREIERGQEQDVGAALKRLQELQRQKLIQKLDKVKGLDE